jgi:sulfur-oxidizing protein SoxX
LQATKVGLPDNSLCAFHHLYSLEKPLETLVIPAPARTALTALALLMFAQLVHAQSGAADGQKIAFDRGKGNCLTCHVIRDGDSPGTIGPALADIKTKYPDRNDLIAIVSDETKRNPLTVMPPFGRNRVLTEKEINAIVDFLQTL